MNKTEAKSLIVSLLTSEKVKTTEFICRDELDILYKNKISILPLIDELVREGKVKEFEYTDPEMPYRVKTMISLF